MSKTTPECLFYDQSMNFLFLLDPFQELQTQYHKYLLTEQMTGTEFHFILVAQAVVLWVLHPCDFPEVSLCLFEYFGCQNIRKETDGTLNVGKDATSIEFSFVPNGMYIN